MSMLLLNIKYKYPQLKIKLDKKKLLQFGYIDTELFLKTFNEVLKYKFDNIVGFHFTLGGKRPEIENEPFIQITSDNKEFLTYLNEIAKKINSSSQFMCETIEDKKIGSAKIEMNYFLHDFFKEKIIEHNKTQGLSFLRLGKSKTTLKFTLDLKKFELGIFDYADFKHILEIETKNQINNFQLSYYPNDTFSFENIDSTSFKIISSNEEALDELKIVFKKLNEHSIYFYDQLNNDKHNFFRNELPIIFQNNIEKEILNQKLATKTSTTKKFKL